MNVLISNFDSNVKEQDLKDLFKTFGEVASAEVVNDVFTGKSRGFGYVEMPDEESALTAIEKLNRTDWQGLTVSVEQAKPKIVNKGSYKVGNGAVNVYKFRKN